MLRDSIKIFYHRRVCSYVVYTWFLNFNTKFLSFNTQFLGFSTRFISLNTLFLKFSTWFLCFNTKALELYGEIVTNGLQVLFTLQTFSTVWALKVYFCSITTSYNKL